MTSSVVSIHAPPRGGRRGLPGRVAGQVTEAFNPRLRAGGDHFTPLLAAEARFNPRLRAGGDAATLQASYKHVPIHASAREATRRGQPPLRLGSFNPRLRAGGDIRQRPSSGLSLSFNPRLRAGGDQRGMSGGSVTAFQSTPRAGGDFPIDDRPIRRDTFQSTPPRGRRRSAI